MYSGRIFRPPSEGRSLILQVTIGCAQNTCTFCSMYKEKSFEIKPLEEVIEHIRVCAAEMPWIDRIFIADGDALVLPMSYWISLLTTLRTSFKALNRITTYGTAKDVLNKTEDELLLLKRNGLEMVYMGLESGSDRILNVVNKQMTAQEMIDAGQRLKKVGIKQSITVISGLGGIEHTNEHAIESARVLSEMDPEYIGLLTLLLDEDAPLYKDQVEGRFVCLSPLQVLEETKLLLTNLSVTNSVFRSNHASNYLSLSGVLPMDQEQLIKSIDRGIQTGFSLKSESFRRL